MTFLRLRLLGAPRIERDGHYLHFERRRALALGVYLAVTGQTHSRDALVTLFWPEADSSSGRANLRRTLHTLGRTVGEEFVVAEGDQVYFHHNGNLWIDLEHFRALLESAVATRHQHGHRDDVLCPECLRLLTQAADLYRDDFLAGFTLPDSPEFDRWQFFQSEQLRVEMALVLELLTRGFINQGHYTQAIVYAQRRLAFDPLYEPAHRQLMQLYAWTEQAAAAQRQYTLCTRLLAQELGVPPAPETEELHRDILARRLLPPIRRQPETTADAPPPAEDDIRVVSAVSLGLATDEDAADVATRAAQVQHLLQMATEIAHRYGGHIERVVGEDVLVLFGHNRIHEDDVERAVHTALDAQRSATRQALSIQIGVNTGMAYCRRVDAADVTVMGAVVNLATRLRNCAVNDQVLVGRNTYLATRGLCEYVSNAVRLPGAIVDTPAYAVVQQRIHVAKVRGIEGLSSELVGRDQEVAQLQAALAKAWAGEGQVVAIVGEAGVGKSRLVAELKQIAKTYHGPASSAPALWLEGRGVEHAMGASYWLFADMLRAHFAEHATHNGSDPADLARNVHSVLQELASAGYLRAEETDEIGPPLGWLLSLRFDTAWDTQLHGVSADQVRLRAFGAVQRYLMALAKRQPLVLVFEDLHWADQLSFDLVLALLDALPANPLLLLCVYRPEAALATDELATQVRQKCAARFRELLIHGLSPLQSRQMLASLLAIEQLPTPIREQILAKALGNPLFLEEIVRSLLDSGAIYRKGRIWRGRADEATITVPESVQSVVLSRVDHLELSHRQLLRAASVFGRLFRPSVLAYMIPQTIKLDATLSTLTGQDFVYLERTQPETEYSFRHVLVRDAIYEDLPPTQREELHRHAGQALEERYAAELQPYVEELAYHYDLGQSPHKAIQFLLRAGQKAQRAYLNQEALSFFRRALARVEALPAEAEPPSPAQAWRLAALRGVGEVNATLGNLSEAEPSLRQAMTLAKQLDMPPTEQALLYFSLSHLFRWLGRFEDLFRLGQEGLVLLGQEGGDEVMTAEGVMMMTTLALAAYMTGRRRQYRALTGLVVDRLSQLEYRQQLMTAYGMAAWWYRDAKQVAAALSWMHSLEEEALRRNDLWALGYLLCWPGYWLPEAVGDLRTILANFDRTLGIARKIGDDILRGYALTFLGLVQWGLGNLAEAEKMQMEALAIHEHRGALHMRVLNRKAIGLVRLCLADWSGTIAVLERGLAEADLIHYRVNGVQMSRLGLGYAYRVLGRRAEAAAVFRRVAVEDEADGDGQVWIAFALAGLEQTLDDSVAFRAACREIAAARPAADPLSLVQWWLRPAQPNLEFATCNAIFWQKLDVSEGWTWYDPYADCSYSVDDAGTVIYASHYFRDLWFNNASAPRLMQTVSGDFAVEAVCRIAFPDRPAMGGLVLWKNVNNFLRLGWGAHGPHTLDLMGCLDGRDLYLGRGRLPTEGEKGEMWLRLERVGSTVRGLCSVDGKEWFSVGQVHLRVDDPLEVGLFATGMIQRWAYPAAYPDGAAVRFQSFRLWWMKATQCPGEWVDLE